MIFIRSVFTCFTIWIVTAIFNALLSGTGMMLLDKPGGPGWSAALLITFVFTLIFSVPGLFVCWLVLLINRNDALLFQYLLKTGIIVSSLSSLLLFLFNEPFIREQQLLLSICPVIALLAALMLHHRSLKSFSNTQ